MYCAIWYNLYNLKKREKHQRSVTFPELQAEARNFTKSNTPSWVFFTFFKCFAQIISNKSQFPKKIFRGNLNEAISLGCHLEDDVNFSQ